ncbi:hypothetical protein ACJJTC_017186 [Scirpophaga incertulas]
MLHYILYIVAIIILLLTDNFLGNGLVDILKKILCKMICFVIKSIRQEAMLTLSDIEKPISVWGFLVEMLALFLLVLILKQYKHIRYQDRMDELLQESNDYLRQSNEFLDKWRLRRLLENSDSDEKSQGSESIQLEVPIFHMAIIDPQNTERNQLERGDSINNIDSTMLSATSLLDDLLTQSKYCKVGNGEQCTVEEPITIE